MNSLCVCFHVVNYCIKMHDIVRMNFLGNLWQECISTRHLPSSFNFPKAMGHKQMLLTKNHRLCLQTRIIKSSWTFRCWIFLRNSSVPNTPFLVLHLSLLYREGKSSFWYLRLCILQWELECWKAFISHCKPCSSETRRARLAQRACEGAGSSGGHSEIHRLEDGWESQDTGWGCRAPMHFQWRTGLPFSGD